jgi:hypothetical protein
MAERLAEDFDWIDLDLGIIGELRNVAILRGAWEELKSCEVLTNNIGTVFGVLYLTDETIREP